MSGLTRHASAIPSRIQLKRLRQTGKTLALKVPGRYGPGATFQFTLANILTPRQRVLNHIDVAVNADGLFVSAVRPRRLAASDIANIGLNCVYHLIDTTGENQFPHGQPEANDLVSRDMGRQRNRVGIGHYINQCGTRMLKRLL